MAKQNKNLRDIVNKIWPNAKRDLEKGLKETKKFIDQGEKHVMDLTDKSIKNVKKISLQVNREKLYYELGKKVAHIPSKNWVKSSTISKLIDSIKDLNSQISVIKRQEKKNKKK